MSNKMLSRTNIEWVRNPDGSKGYVFNPVWGCLNSCSFCYARKIAKRFAFKIAEKEKEYCLKNNIRYSDISKDLEEFKPVFLESNFSKKLPKKPSRIFVNSMSDIAFWDRDWMLRVLGKIKDNPQHQFLFLTKDPVIYRKFVFTKNCILGVSVNIQEDLERIRYLRYKKYIDKDIDFIFISFEPLLENFLGDEMDLSDVNWIIIGGMTGKKPFYPPEEWINNIRCYADKHAIPIFLKDNLFPEPRRSLYKLIQEFPFIPGLTSLYYREV